MPDDKPTPVASPPGRAVWPKLTAPDFRFDPDGVYSVQLALEGEVAETLIAEIDAAMERSFEAAKKELAKKPRAKKPKRASAPYQEEVDYFTQKLTGATLFHFKRKAKGKTKDGKEFEVTIPIFDAKKKRLTDVPSIGMGSTIRVSYVLREWYVPALGAGVSLQLRGVQLLELVQWQGATAESLGFDEEEGWEGPSSEPPGEELPF